MLAAGRLNIIESLVRRPCILVYSFTDKRIKNVGYGGNPCNLGYILAFDTIRIAGSIISFMMMQRDYGAHFKIG